LRSNYRHSKALEWLPRVHVEGEPEDFAPAAPAVTPEVVGAGVGD